MANILALDTTMGACSVAITNNGQVIANMKEIRVRGHVERLIPMIDELMVQTDIELSDLDFLAVAIGPGTFAGVRIGLSSTKGMALALDIPIIVTNTLEAIAFEFANKKLDYAGQLNVVADARRGELYVQSFKVKSGVIDPVGDAKALPIEDVQTLLESENGAVIGSGVEHIDCNLEKIEGYDHPDAQYIAQLALMRTDDARSADDVTPLYLRAPDAVKPAPFSVTVTDE